MNSLQLSEHALTGPAARTRIPLVMGVLNITPDSFYGESRTPTVEQALRRGLALAEEGADLLDIGGESTRPGSAPVSEEEECWRVLPVLERLSGRLRIPISVDTSKAGVARRALEAGATILNDVTALRSDPSMAKEAIRYDHVILMHMQGTPRDMQKAPHYGDVVREIAEFFRGRLEAFARAGGDSAKVWLDPGIGFGKDLGHNLELLRRLESFHPLGRPLVLGVSRKSFLGSLLGSPQAPIPPEERLEGSLAVACRAALAGVKVLRVHDVRATKRALTAFSSVLEPFPAAAP